MKILCFFTVFFIVSLAQAQIVDIPDENFKYILTHFGIADLDGDGVTDGVVDTNSDDEIQVTEAEAVFGLQLFPIEIISSLEGIESFINLEWLSVLGHDLEILDLSQNVNLENLTCSSTPLTNIIFPQNSNLMEIYCTNNNLSSIDVSSCTNLTKLTVGNNQLTNLDLTENLDLEELYCWLNDITEINVANSINLINLDVSSNQLSTLDLTQNQKLRYLNIEANLITEIDLSHNSELTQLFCVANLLHSLDVSQNTKLEYIRAQSNFITSLDFSQNTSLNHITCNNNQLTNLNVQNGIDEDLNTLWAFDNPDLLCIKVDEENYGICDIFYDTGWCIGEGTLLSEDCVLAIEDANKVNFVISPNPVQDILFIESQERIESVTIFSFHGGIIQEAISNRIDVSQLNAGMYFLQVIVSGKSEIRKFIKN